MRRQLLDDLYPEVRYVHRHTVVEAVAAVLELGSQTRHAAHLLSYSDSLWVHLVYEQVGKREVADGIVVLMTVEVVAVVAERLAQTMTVVEH